MVILTDVSLVEIQITDNYLVPQLQLPALAILDIAILLEQLSAHV